MRVQRGTEEKQRAEQSASRGLKEYTQNITMRDGYESEIRIHKPKSPPDSGSPLVVLLFGGGFIMGSNMQLSPYAHALAETYGATVVNLSYRLAPEHKFPAGPNDVWDSLIWLAENASSIGADPSAGFILGGASAGGNLTAVTAQRYVSEKHSPPLTGLWFSIPAVLVEDNVPAKYRDLWFSREQNSEAPILDNDAINHMLGFYEPDLKSSLYSPFNATDPHLGLPPSYFQVAGLDPLRDDGLIYEKVLKEHGVKTKLDVYTGVPHGHFAFLPFLKASQKSNVDSIVGIGWLLGKTANPEEIAKALTPPAAA